MIDIEDLKTEEIKQEIDICLRELENRGFKIKQYPIIEGKIYKILAHLKTKDKDSKILKFLTDDIKKHRNNLNKMKESTLINIFYEGITTDKQDIEEFERLK